MQILSCQICSREFSSIRGLHGHVSKSHKGWDTGDYYHHFFPRYDLYTKELISYKNYEQYHRDDFNSKENFSQWLLENYKNVMTLEWCVQKLKERCERKNDYSLPSHFELKSLMLPSIFGWEKLFNGKLALNSKLLDIGIKTRFDYFREIIWENRGNFTLYQDSREQMPLLLDCKVEKVKLPIADYTVSPPYFDNVYIERKSLSDLVGTLTGGLERFKNEIEKANTLGAYIVVIIEDLYANISHYTSTNKYTRKVNGAHILKIIRDIMSDYNCIQFVSAGSRKRASELCVKILKLGSQVKNLDCEFLKDSDII